MSKSPIGRTAYSENCTHNGRGGSEEGTHTVGPTPKIVDESFESELQFGRSAQCAMSLRTTVPTTSSKLFVARSTSSGTSTHSTMPVQIPSTAFSLPPVLAGLDLRKHPSIIQYRHCLSPPSPLDTTPVRPPLL